MKVGDLVMIRHNDLYSDSGETGVIQWTDNRPGNVPTCGVAMIVAQRTEVYAQKMVVVLNESR